MASSWAYWLLDRTVYNQREPPPRVRDPAKPMQVIAVGFPRSATESLQHAFLELGYDNPYHGWDILFEEPHRMRGWIALARRKGYSDASEGERHISAADFDALLGHATAVCDAAASVFAAEIIAAYPQAQVVLNTRADLDAWWRSAVKNIGDAEGNWLLWAMSWTTPWFFHAWAVYYRHLWPLLFRATDHSVSKAIRRNGKWIYREHCAMVRGLVPREKLLEWTVEDGWEPLCKFLNKPVPSIPFPRTNDAAGFQSRVDHAIATNLKQSAINVSLTTAVLGAALGCYFAPGTAAAAGQALRRGVLGAGTALRNALPRAR